MVKKAFSDPNPPIITNVKLYFERLRVSSSYNRNWFVGFKKSKK